MWKTGKPTKQTENKKEKKRVPLFCYTLTLSIVLSQIEYYDWYMAVMNRMVIPRSYCPIPPHSARSAYLLFPLPFLPHKCLVALTAPVIVP